jgi:ubiquinone/menaquinone biosynthesis C-methylase UbiE
MLQQRVADQAGSTNAHFLLASGQSLPYRNDAFDALLCTSTFHHFPAPNYAMQEFRRVLRPGGKVIIADPCRDQSVGTWVWDRLHRWFEKGHVKYYRKEELFALLQEAGFERIALTERNPSYFDTRKLIPNAAIFSARVSA